MADLVRRTQLLRRVVPLILASADRVLRVGVRIIHNYTIAP